MTTSRRLRHALAASVAVLALTAGHVAATAPAHAVNSFTVSVVWVDLEGTVQPVSNAIVTVTTRDYIAPSDRSSSLVRDFTADSSGVAQAYTLQSLGSTEVRVSARAPGGAIDGVTLTTAFWGQSLTIEQADFMHRDAVGPVTIVLHPTTTVTGRVAATAGGSVGTAASVLLWHRATPTSDWRPVQEVRTNSSGRFTATAVPRGDYRFELRSAGSGRLFGRSFHPLERFVDDAQTYSTGATSSTDVGTLSIGSWSLDTDRLRGPDRYATAIEVSKQVYPSPVVDAPDVVYVVSGGSFPDALSASPLASARGGVLLLTAPTQLPRSVEVELQRLKPRTIVITGGTGVISASVERRIRTLAQGWGVSDVTRVSGTDRYATSRALVRHAMNEGGQTFIGGPVFVATGTNFPDALSAATAAGATGMPLILVGYWGDDVLPGATIRLLDDLEPSKVFIAGGWGSVSPTAMNSYAWPRNVPVVRFGGVDRYETSRMINDAFFGRSETTLVASGTQFPDALAAGPLSVALGAPLALTPPTCVNPGLARSLARQGTEHALLIGGMGALSARVAAMASC